MKQSMIKRLERVEDRQNLGRRSGETSESMPPIEVARRVLFMVAEGKEAKRVLDAAGASLSSARRAELTKTLETARSVVATLAKYGVTTQVETGELA